MKLFTQRILVVLVSLGLVSTACSEVTTTQPSTLEVPRQPSRQLADTDICWSDMVYGCSDQSTAADILFNAPDYQNLGGTASCYNSQNDGCGGGFGNWDDDVGCGLASYPVGGGPCYIVAAGSRSSLKNCPTTISFFSTNVTTGEREDWDLTKTHSYFKYNPWDSSSYLMSHYEGTVVVAGVTYDTGWGNMVCRQGVLIAGAHN